MSFSRRGGFFDDRDGVNMFETLLLAAETVPVPPLSLELRIPFSVLHFLEFAIWGSWFVVLGNYLNTLQFSRKDIGRIYSTVSIGSVIAPMFVGTIADRFFPTEHVLAVSHLIGAVLLYAMSQIKQPRLFFIVALCYALAYAPTLALVNSIVFAHVTDAARDFPTIRVLGTIGWILAGWSLKFLIKPGQPVNNRPLILAAVMSLILGVYCFFLPHTPPQADSSEIPFVKALSLLTDPSFAVFYGVSFFITIALAFYFSFTSLFLEQEVKVKSENVGPIMSIGQLVEIYFLFNLEWFLDHWGMKNVILVGMAAWGLRYFFFAAQKPFPLILLGVALHGICFDFFFAAGFIHVQNTAPADISASGQSLFAVLTYGLGMWIGTEASGWLNHFFTTEQTDPATGITTKTTDWRKFWLVPCVGVVLSLIVFAFLFQPTAETSDGIAAPPVEEVLVPDPRSAENVPA
ncbi:MAG: MFS transporter [Planctomycetota bacterium]|nr:MFS transporter [Planctomycetota bacterium]MDA1213074.1 MFS transporter [Planctomycetota bacterium]